MEIKIKIKGEGIRYSKDFYFPDYYNFSKANKQLEEIVRKTCDECGFSPIEEVKIISKMEW